MFTSTTSTMSSVSLGDLFTALPSSLQHHVISMLDYRTLASASLACKLMQGLAQPLSGIIRVPVECTPEELAAAPLHVFPGASCVVISDYYENLTDHDIESFLEAHLPIQMPQLKALVIQGLKLQDPKIPLRLSVLQSLAAQWPKLQRFSFIDTKLSCPLNCTNPETLDRLLRQLFRSEGQASEGRPIPQLVAHHEARETRNIMVTQLLFEFVGKLQQLQELNISSDVSLHVHNLAVMQLAQLTCLRKLKLELPSHWPLVTGSALKVLPTCLEELTLTTSRPALYWEALAALPIRACHLYVRCDVTVPLVESNLPTLPALPSLSTLMFRSSCTDTAADQQGLEAQEAVLLGMMLRAAPQLQLLEVLGAGQQLVELVAANAPTVPLQSLRMSCHSDINIQPLLQVPAVAQLSLTLRGVGIQQLQAICGHELQPSAAAAPDADSLHDPHQPHEAAGNRKQPQLHTPQASASRPQTRSQSKALQQANSRAAAGPQSAAATASSSSVTRSHSHQQQQNQQQQQQPFAPAAPSAQQRSRQQHRSKQNHATSNCNGVPGHEDMDQQAQEQEMGVQPSGASRLAVLRDLHLQRSHEVTDDLLADAVQCIPTLRGLTLTTCRNVTSDLVLAMARRWLPYPIRLRVTSCRLVSAKSWAAAISHVRQLSEVTVLDVKYPCRDDVGNEVELMRVQSH